MLSQAAVQPTYYHLAFFYYFIPLYFVAPFLRRIAQRAPTLASRALPLVWLVALIALVWTETNLLNASFEEERYQ